MEFRYLLDRRAAKTQASLCVSTVSPEPSLLVHLKYERRWRLILAFGPLATLDKSASIFKNVFTHVQ